jgi:DNA-binding transcriptional LysR family regulator
MGVPSGCAWDDSIIESENSMVASSVPRIDPYSVRLFVSAAKEGSIARAAKKENIAASALSRRITELEHELGSILLIRSIKGIELTTAGQCVLDRGVRIEDDLRNLVKDVSALSGVVTGTVRLFANASSIVGSLPERLQRFSGSYPDVDIALEEHRSWEVVRACLDDRADVGISVAADVPKGLDAWHFATDPLQVILPADHALANEEQLKFRQVVENRMVGIQPGGALDQLVKHQASVSKLRLKLSVSVNSFDAACRMVQAGMGIAIVPVSAAAAYAGSPAFVRVKLDEAWIDREIRIYALRKTPRLPAVELLIKALQEP